MALLFEYCFYVGVLLVLVGGVLLLRFLVGKKWRRCITALALMLTGTLLVVGPAVYSRSLEVDLGPRDAKVNGERHLTLTGWNGENYGFLASQSDVVVLQMANSDVNDQTLQLLSNMKHLRELDLNDTAVTDRGLVILGELTSLQTLRLRGTRITDEGFQDHLIEHPKLLQLDLRNTQLSDDLVTRWKSMAEGRRALR